MLLAPTGELVMAAGDGLGLDLDRVARLARRMAARGRRAFQIGKTCVHVLPLTAGWTLCAITRDIEPSAVISRLRRARAVLALALEDGAATGSDGGSSGSPAQVAILRRGR